MHLLRILACIFASATVESGPCRNQSAIPFKCRDDSKAFVAMTPWFQSIVPLFISLSGANEPTHRPVDSEDPRNTCSHSYCYQHPPTKQTKRIECKVSTRNKIKALSVSSVHQSLETCECICSGYIWTGDRNWDSGKANLQWRVCAPTSSFAAICSCFNHARPNECNS